MSGSDQRSQAIISSLRAFLAAEKPEPMSAIKDDENLFDAGVIDSFQLVTLVAFIQNEFALEFDFDDLTEEKFSTLSAISRFIAEKQ